jgi:hypothetical protein
MSSNKLPATQSANPTAAQFDLPTLADSHELWHRFRGQATTVRIAHRPLRFSRFSLRATAPSYAVVLGYAVGEIGRAPAWLIVTSTRNRRTAALVCPALLGRATT